MIDGHTLEFRMSGSGSIDPWTREYCQEHNIPLIGTADIKEFVRVDSHYIYRITKGYGDSDFFKMYERGDLKTFDQVQDWLLTNTKLEKTMDQIDPRKKDEDSR